MNQVSIKIRFVGHLAKKAGKEEIMIQAAESILEASAAIKAGIEKEIGNSVLYSVTYNGVSLALVQKDSTKLKPGDEFSVVPVILGG